MFFRSSNPVLNAQAFQSAQSYDSTPMTAQGAIDPELSEVDEAFNKWLDTTTGYGLSMRRILDRPYDHAPTFIAGYMAALKRRIEGEGK